MSSGWVNGKIVTLPNIKKKIGDDEWHRYVLKVGEIENVAAIQKHDYYVSQYRYGDLVQEIHVCKVFGCGSRLTLQERLFSDHCIIHNNKKNS